MLWTSGSTAFGRNIMRPVHQQFKLLVPGYCYLFQFLFAASFIRRYTCSVKCKFPLKTYTTFSFIFFFFAFVCILGSLYFEYAQGFSE